MAELEGSKTLENLKEAFAGESQANRKYLAFAKQADADGYPQVAKLFRAAAEAETIHAHAHLRAMEGVGSTKDNLLAAVGGETYEFESMYPGMIADAKKEGFKKAERSFDNANDVEQIHAKLYQKALDTLGQTVAVVDYYVCPVCGNTVEGKPTDPCPICGTPANRFFKVD
ncbi:MAG: rubrerythrin family protein [Anaerolineae bacterium]